MWYSYRSVPGGLELPPAPILPATLINPKQSDDRLYELDAYLDTGADVTLIPLEAVSILRLLEGRISVVGVGGAVTTGFPCQIDFQIGKMHLPLLDVVGCTAMSIGKPKQMIVGRDILNQFCITFDGKQRRFSFDADNS